MEKENNIENVPVLSGKVRKGFAEIFSINIQIIKGLIAQLARQEQLFDSYSEDVKIEVDIPSNKYLYWAGKVRPFLDNVVSTKLLSYQTIECYKSFIDDLINYEKSYLDDTLNIENIGLFVDFIMKKVKLLEKKIKDNDNVLLKQRINFIKSYQDLPSQVRGRKNHCKYCGANLLLVKGTKDNVCFDCVKIPEKERPFLNKIFDEKVEDKINIIKSEEVIVSKETESKNIIPTETAQDPVINNNNNVPVKDNKDVIDFNALSKAIEKEKLKKKAK